MAVYALSKISSSWDAHPVPEEVKQGLVARGVFDDQGNIQQAGFLKFLEECIVLPAATSEVGYLSLYDEVKPGENVSGVTKSERIASWLGKRMDDIGDESVVQAIKRVPELSARILEQVNEENMTKGPNGENRIPEETIAIVRSMSFKKNAMFEAFSANGSSEEHEAVEAISPELSFASDIIKASRAIQAMVKPKAHKKQTEPIPWPTIRKEILKLEIEEAVHSYVFDLFIEKLPS